MWFVGGRKVFVNKLQKLSYTSLLIFWNCYPQKWNRPIPNIPNSQGVWSRFLNEGLVCAKGINFLEGRGGILPQDILKSQLCFSPGNAIKFTSCSLTCFVQILIKPLEKPSRCLKAAILKRQQCKAIFWQNNASNFSLKLSGADIRDLKQTWLGRQQQHPNVKSWKGLELEPHCPWEILSLSKTTRIMSKIFQFIYYTTIRPMSFLKELWNLF